MPNEDNNLNPTNPNQNGQTSGNNQGQNGDNQILGNFNFDFGLDTGNETNSQGSTNGIQGNFQQQDNNVQQQENGNTGKSGLFFSPNENQQNIPNEGNMPASINTENVDNSRSGKFLTPDEEDKKTVSSIPEGGPAFTIQQPPRPAQTPEEINAEEDAFFENIDLGDNTTNTESTEINNDIINEYSPEPTNSSPDLATNNIENPVNYAPNEATNYTPNETTNYTSNETTNYTPNEDTSYTPNETTNYTSNETTNYTPNETSNTNTNEQLNYDLNIENNNETSNNEGNDTKISNNDDWLLQEDKKVEETFGQNTQELNQDNMNFQNNITEGSHPKDTNDMYGNTQVENGGTNNTENLTLNNTQNTGAGPISNIQGEVHNEYTPNENEFSQITNLLGSSATGAIDLGNISQEPANQQPISNTENETINELISDPTVQENVESIEITQPDENNEIKTEKINLDSTQNTTTQTTAPMEISLDSILLNNQSTNNTGNDGNTTTQTEQTPITNAVQPQEEAKVTETLPKKRKKNGGIGLVILILIILGAAALRFIKKMAPDLLTRLKATTVNNLLDNNVIETTIDNNDESNELEINSGDINDNEVTYPELGGTGEDTGIENNAEIVEENPNESTGSVAEVDTSNITGSNENTDEPLDPNSLAALLENENVGVTGNTTNNESTGENVNELTNEDQNNTHQISGGDNNFDPFAEIDNIITDNNDDISKLNGYITQGEFFQDRGETNENMIVKIYGKHIIESAQAELTKLENGEEIDKSIYDSLDDQISNLMNIITPES